MRNIIVVDCKSTGLNYIGDIINRGYNPVVLEMKWNNDDVEEYHKTLNAGYDTIDYKFDMIIERDTYEETLEVVKKWDPELIVPGNEHGVVLATKLANDLNLLCNPIENMDYFTLKDKMQERLAEAGLRHIKGKSVNSLDEAIEFYESEGLKEVVVKPLYSACSVGVHICINKQEMIDAVKDVFSTENYYGQKIDEIVIQERIKGEEYIVNTTSCDGVHRLTLIWKYNKIKTPDGSILYDTMESVNRLGIGEAEMVEYAYDVADALGIKYGPVHGEYMLDENGPVLIEVNCRPCGASMPSGFLDKIAGHHETDAILDSYLKPKRFHQKRTEKYRLLSNGSLKLFIVPEDIVAKSAPMNNISPKLESFYSTNLNNINGTEMFFVKTIDLDTSCGFVYLINDDRGALLQDIEFLRNVERDAFSLILSDKEEDDIIIDEDKIVSNIKKIVDITGDYGTGLLITDQFIDADNIMQKTLEDLEDFNSQLDYVIINLNKSLISMNDDDIVKLMINALSKVKVGGLVSIPESTYKLIPSKRKGMEALLITLGLRIEIPPHGIKAGIIALREH